MFQGTFEKKNKIDYSEGHKMLFYKIGAGSYAGKLGTTRYLD